ncbi:hypothetical protein Csp1_01000 [Corynebacterium provencense]|uniref:Uncharacterized protein n=1 Tax=Corynebacterium provencense TaxID=1737425 RepID=A0A2Z3YMA0_9CORY|nr:hypothetical protein [Corynebacterium provencense]AWT24928.1 hypothetical protein Csp1_01000 [Corynebacterium provencense]
MHYTTFGRRTGLRVSQYALASGNFGTCWGVGAERDDVQAIFTGWRQTVQRPSR